MFAQMLENCTQTASADHPRLFCAKLRSPCLTRCATQDSVLITSTTTHNIHSPSPNDDQSENIALGRHASERRTHRSRNDTPRTAMHPAAPYNNTLSATVAHNCPHMLHLLEKYQNGNVHLRNIGNVAHNYSHFDAFRDISRSGRARHMLLCPIWQLRG